MPISDSSNINSPHGGNVFSDQEDHGYIEVSPEYLKSQHAGNISSDQEDPGYIEFNNSESSNGTSICSATSDYSNESDGLSGLRMASCNP